MYVDIVISNIFYLNKHFFFLLSFIMYIWMVWCERCLGWKRLERWSVNNGRFKINQLIFADDTALVANSEEKLCRLESEFGRVCKRRKLSECR